MATRPNDGASVRLTLQGDTAADLMVAPPGPLPETATFKEAVALFTDKGISAAPVVNRAGRLTGVVSRADLLVHEREKADSSAGPGDATRVADVMTPAVFSVTPETPAAKVVEEMLALNVHQLFVVDQDVMLKGMIGTLDVLRHLRPAGPGEQRPVAPSSAR